MVEVNVDNIGLMSNMKVGNKAKKSNLVKEKPKPEVHKVTVEDLPFGEVNEKTPVKNQSVSKKSVDTGVKKHRQSKKQREGLLKATRVSLKNHHRDVNPDLNSLISPVTYYDQRFDEQVNGFLSDKNRGYVQSVKVNGMHVGPLIKVAIVKKFKERFLRQKICTKEQFENQVEGPIADGQWLLLNCVDSLDTLNDRLTVALAYHQEFEQQKARHGQTRVAKIRLWEWYVIYLNKVKDASGTEEDPSDVLPDAYQNLSMRQLIAVLIQGMLNQQQVASQTNASLRSVRHQFDAQRADMVVTRRLAITNLLYAYGVDLTSHPDQATTNDFVLQFDNWLDTQVPDWEKRVETKQETRRTHHRK